MVNWTNLMQGEKVDGGLAPPDLRYPEEAHGPTMIDDLPEGSEYGDVVMDVEDTYTVVGLHLSSFHDSFCGL